MSLGLELFTAFHVLISLVGIVSGFGAIYFMVASNTLGRWNTIFLPTTAATSITGFFFPVQHFMPSHAVGILSLIVLGLAYAALYRFHLDGSWRRTYAISAVVALYFNVFVLIVQSFAKIPALKEAAPTQSEPPFVIAQSVCLLLFIAIGVRAAMKFRPEGLSYSAHAGRA